MSILKLEPLGERLIAMRRHLHANPELSHEEYETTATILRWLSEANIRIANYPLQTGAVAEVGGMREGPVIAIRADIDALPIQEATGLPYASRNKGKMHACGHDFHTAAVVGAAMLLKMRESELQGTVRFLFQPAEEKAKGAQQVIASGALQDVRAIFGLHNKPDLTVGTIGIKAGPIMAAADGFIIEVLGRGSHAAIPEAGVDSIVASAHIVTALQSIVSRNVGALESAVVSVTRIQSGTAWNVISDKSILEGTVRTFEPRIRENVRERFEHIVAGVANAFDASAKVTWLDGPPAVSNDTNLADLAVRSAEKTSLRVIVPAPSPAGEDFAYYLQETPGLFVFLGTEGPQEWHHPAFDVDERALEHGAAFFAALALDALEQFQQETNTEGRGGRDHEPIGDRY
ncbi:hydrolase [Paenibacillus swuensis]|uniref:Hydrolase n=1 Tax=Paenibacillus swuensis TaxID=1178515 RepID=A0A172THL8_9BACL|nr:amidohydrolase [Paenibacillus swuensis]ANE46384.1 hydrolase [Paenibacillus swuensis]